MLSSSFPQRLTFFFIAIICTAGCKNDSVIPTSLEQANELVWIEGGNYQMGKEDVIDASPLVAQQIEGFWINKYKVTNVQFAAFVAATNYITLAEKNGGSYVFDAHAENDSMSLENAPWWKYTKGANWKNSQGNKNITSAEDYLPASHIAYEDACAYCDWLDMRLPTEAEWEFVARENDAIRKKNIWQGNFPFLNNASDGFERASPVGSFPAGKKSLNDLNGNVWEWCSDYYHENWYPQASNFSFEERRKGPIKSFDAHSPTVVTRVIRGGSFLCSESYCTGYLPHTRMRSSIEQTFEHIGFRCVKTY